MSDAVGSASFLIAAVLAVGGALVGLLPLPPRWRAWGFPLALAGVAWATELAGAPLVAAAVAAMAVWSGRPLPTSPTTESRAQRSLASVVVVLLGLVGVSTMARQVVHTDVDVAGIEQYAHADAVFGALALHWPLLLCVGLCGALVRVGVGKSGGAS